jgi:oligoribonuclease NrnB/cAMP/cGMP phosphodiesterase (DHH superfamily)
MMEKAKLEADAFLEKYEIYMKQQNEHELQQGRDPMGGEEHLPFMPLEEEIMYPGDWWYSDLSEKRKERKAELKRELSTASVVGIVDSDADGLGSEVVLREKFGDDVVVIQGRGNSYGISLGEALGLVRDYGSNVEQVFVADIAPGDKFSGFLGSLGYISEKNISIYDHHEWSDEAYVSISAVANEIVVDHGSCSAKILQENILPDCSDSLREFILVTDDHDRWVKEDKERSDNLSTLSFAIDREDYVSGALEHGIGILDEYREEIEEQEEMSRRKAEIVEENAVWEEIAGYTVAITYGDCHQSRVGNDLINEGADVVAVIQPRLKLSIRASEETPVAEEICSQFNGGGHDTAAGVTSFYSQVTTPEGTNAYDHTHENNGQPAIDAVERMIAIAL